MPELYPGYAHDMTKICPQYDQDMPKNARDMPDKISTKMTDWLRNTESSTYIQEICKRT